MATLIYTIPIDGLNAEEMINAFSLQNGWQPIIDGEPNPQSATEFARLMLNRFIESSIANYNARIAAETARIAAQNAVTSSLASITTTLEVI